MDSALEQIYSDVSWMPPDAQIINRPEVLYAHCPRDIRSLNAVYRLDAAEARMPALVGEISVAHGARRSRWAVVARNRSAILETALRSAGYERGDEHFAYAIDVQTAKPRPVSKFVVRPVDSIDRLKDAWRTVEIAFGHGPCWTEADLALQLEACLGSKPQVVRVVAYDRVTGEPVSSGGLGLSRPLRFGLLWGGGTVPAHRGRGAYAAVLAARITLARHHGLTHVGLYARIGSSAPIVERFGFTRYGGLTYWDRP